MKKLLGTAGIFCLLGLGSCVDHEIIPPPVKLVELKCECEATIDGVLVSFKDTCTTRAEKQISSSGPSSAAYSSNVQNSSLTQGVEIEMRSVTWNDDGSSVPPVGIWESFFTSNMMPPYSVDIAEMGVVVKWTDPQGKIWISNTVTAGNDCTQSFEFQSIVLEEDVVGTYMQFQAVFNGVLLNSDYGVTDSAKCIQNALIKSAFKWG